MRPSVPSARRNWPLRRLAGKAPSCKPTGNIGCRFEVRDFAPGRAGANPAPREAGPEAGDGSAAQTCSSVPPAETEAGFGGVCVSKNRILGSASELVLGVKREDATARFLRRGFPYGFFSRDTSFCLYSKVSYPGFRAPRAKAAYAIRQACEKRTGEHRENGAGEDRDSLHDGSMKGYGR